MSFTYRLILLNPIHYHIILSVDPSGECLVIVKVINYIRIVIINNIYITKGRSKQKKGGWKRKGGR